MPITTYQPKASAEVGRVMRDARERAGISVAYMSAATGWTERQIRNWEHGTSPVKRGVVVAWAVICGRDPDELVSAVAARTAGCQYVLDLRDPIDIDALVEALDPWVFTPTMGPQAA